MRISLELWTNKVYSEEVNQCTLSTNASTHFYKQALNGKCRFSGIGLKGEGYLALACPLNCTV